MLRFHRQAVARDGEDIGEQRLVLLHGFVHGEGGGDILHHCANADRQGAGTHLAAHHGLGELLFTALRILLHKGLHHHVGIAEFGQGSLHYLDCHGLVVLDADVAARTAQDLLHYGGTHYYLLRVLQHQAVVAGEERLAFGTVDEQRLSSRTARSGIQFHVGGEGGTAKADNAVSLDALQHHVAVVRNSGYQIRGGVDAGGPLVSGNFNFDMGDGAACQVGTGGNALHRSCGRTVHEGRDESCRFGYHLAGKHLVTYGHHRLRRGAEMLGHRHEKGLRKGQVLDGTVLRQLRILGMNSAD